MSVPFDFATTFLTGQSAAIRQFYHDSYAEMQNRFGGKTNRLFRPSKLVFQGDGVNVQVMSANMHGARLTNDPNADFPTARAHTSNNYKVTFSETASSNDFRRMSISLQVTHYDINRVYNKQIAADDFRERLISQSMQDVGEKTALHRHLDTTAKVALVNGTPAKNDNTVFASCSAIGTTGGARFPIDNGSIAYLPANLLLDVYASGGAFKRKVIVTDYNPVDSSVGVFGVDAFEAGDSTVNVNDLADNDELYISTEKNMGLNSLGQWFSAPSSGESFYGKDRTTPTNRWMIPTKVPAVASGTTLFSKAHIDNVSIAIGYVEEDPDSGYAALTTPELDQRYRNEVGGDILIPFPSEEAKGKLLANYGFEGSVYRHPTIGRIMLQADQFAPPNKIRLLKVGDWESLYPLSATFEWLVGDTGGWYRMSSSTPGNGKTTVYRMDGMLSFADICRYPRRQAELSNVTAT